MLTNLLSGAALVVRCSNWLAEHSWKNLPRSLLSWLYGYQDFDVFRSDTFAQVININKAYYKADDSIEQIVELLAA